MEEICNFNSRDSLLLLGLVSCFEEKVQSFAWRAQCWVTVFKVLSPPLAIIVCK